VPPPADLDDRQWKRLKDYWTLDAGVEKSEQKKLAKSAVTNQSHLGRGGYSKIASIMVRALHMSLDDCFIFIGNIVLLKALLNDLVFRSMYFYLSNHLT
jgi:hypothetical protein